MNPTPTRPFRQIRAVYDETTITVYQAYSPQIALPAVAAQKFVPPFRPGRMTWIKPSFLWMMYRCGWATKPAQERVLAIKLSRSGFEEALSMACLSNFEAETYASHEQWAQRKAVTPVRVQWDPERDRNLDPLPWRSIQIGLGTAAAQRYVDEWTVAICDITDFVERARRPDDNTPLPDERPYPLPDDLARTIGASL